MAKATIELDVKAKKWHTETIDGKEIVVIDDIEIGYISLSPAPKPTSDPRQATPQNKEVRPL